MEVSRWARVSYVQCSMEVAHQVVLMSSPGFTRTTATVAPANTGVLTFYHAAPHFLLGAPLAAIMRMKGVQLTRIVSQDSAMIP